MSQEVLWELPAVVVVLSAGAAFYGWRLKVRFDRDHPHLTRAALEAESERKATMAIKSNVVPIRPPQKVGGPEPASGTHK